VTKYFLLGITLITIIVGARFFIKQLDSNMSVKSEQVMEVVAPIAQGEVAQPDYAIEESSTQDDLSLASTMTSTINRQTNTGSMDGNTLWSESANQELVPDRFLNKGLNPQALKISHDKIHKLRIGDKISLSIPQLAQSYAMNVEQIRKHRNGDRTVSGHLRDTDLPYSVIITSGVQASFATINTPDGSYVMEAEGDSGWIVSIANLDYLIDTNLDGYIIPDINR